MKTTRNSSILILLVLILAGHSMQAQILKRWSPQAKGTAIGAGTGAAAGAVINKRNRVVGGVIGGVIGAGAGYAVGKHIDNKRKKAAWEAAARQSAGQPVLAAGQSQTPSITKHSNAVAHSAKAPAPGFSAVRPASQAAASKSASYELNEYYLANPFYGDATAPYGMTEYRQKSW